jgi:hypothetical protein
MKGCLLGGLKIFAALAIVVVGFFWLSFYSIHVRYRLTLEVSDDDQIKTGSSVVEASYNIQPDWIWAGPSTFVRIVGYAPTVDLGGRGLLFLSFADASRTPAQRRERNRQVGCGFDDMGCLPFAAYHTPGVNRDFGQRKAALYELLGQSGPRDVPFAVLPELVRFRDINDPHTLAAVSPNDLAAGFGPGVELKRVILQLIDDQVTPMPKIWPQWLKENGHFDDAILKGYQNG